MPLLKVDPLRSKMMAAVRSKGNLSTEVALGRALWAAGVRGYRKHWKVPGRPDFAWPGRKIAIFVDGCFWHGCKRCKYIPRKNHRFWKDKIEANRARDKRVRRRLRYQGWVVLAFWEHDVAKKLDQVVAQVAAAWTAT